MEFDCEKRSATLKQVYEIGTVRVVRVMALLMSLDLHDSVWSSAKKATVKF